MWESHQWLGMKGYRITSLTLSLFLGNCPVGFLWWWCTTTARRFSALYISPSTWQRYFPTPLSRHRQLLKCRRPFVKWPIVFVGFSCSIREQLPGWPDNALLAVGCCSNLTRGDRFTARSCLRDVYKWPTDRSRENPHNSGMGDLKFCLASLLTCLSITNHLKVGNFVISFIVIFS